MYRSHLHKLIAKSITINDCKYTVITSTASWYRDIRNTILISLLGLMLAAFVMGIVASRLAITITKPVEEAVSKQSRFIAEASHELKTPLAVINANIDVLARENGENKWMKYIKEECTHMNQLVTQLLTLCRLDYCMQNEELHRNEMENFDVTNALVQTILPFDSIAYERGATIQADFDEHYDATGSSDDFKKLISILVENAISHTNKFGTITVNAQKRSRNGLSSKSNLIIAVTNTGSSINDEDLPNIFDRFYSARDNGQRQNNFGLGLSIAKSLAVKNNWDIIASSSDNTTTFTVRIPLNS